MDQRVSRIAAIANEMAYSRKDAQDYVDGAPHIKHAALRTLYGELVLEVFDAASQHVRSPRVLDLGAGEGSVTLPFLELGARVTAVDVSERQLETLQEKCKRHGNTLEVRCEDINDTLQRNVDPYDIIAVNSFLHHIPDYLSLIERCIAILAPHGAFFSFQDPLRYDTVSRASRVFTDAGYVLWRLSRGSKGDVIGGIKRRIRRTFGVYLENCYADNAEYHVMRNGVDQVAIKSLFEKHGIRCRIIKYYSTQNRLFQNVGASLGIENTFGIIASRSAENPRTPT